MGYYYPIDNNITTKIYKYVNPEDPNLTEYWMVSYEENTELMTTKSYRSNFEPYNLFQETVNNQRAKLIRYSDIDEKNKEIVSKVMKTDVYNLIKDKDYSYSVKYTDQWGQVEFEKNRIFVNFETIDVNDKEYKTAKFKDKYFMNYIDQNDEFSYDQFTYYAKGIGMVKYERHTPTGEIRILELKEILTEMEFNEVKKASR